MQYILGIIASLVAGLFYFKTKAASSGALLENLETKNTINAEEKEIAKVQGNLQAEQERRAAITDSTKEEVNKNETNEALINFLNSAKRPK